ncbi:MAG TPA: hypothetical protein VD710_03920 [Nitrososphaeraceae archaeon]|nr:hypothetical protein [Nitrososphaeraceae archaeon]
MTRLTVGGILYGLLGSTTFIVSGGVIFAISLLSFRLLRMIDCTLLVELGFQLVDIL